MNWYLAKIVFNIHTGNEPFAKQFDEQFRLIAANNYEEAFGKARVLGLNEEDSIENEKKRKIKWEFVDVADLLPIGDFKDGMEIYSRIHEEDEAGPYIRYLHDKASHIQNSTLLRLAD